MFEHLALVSTDRNFHMCSSIAHGSHFGAQSGTLLRLYITTTLLVCMSTKSGEGVECEGVESEGVCDVMVLFPRTQLRV